MYRLVPMFEQNVLRILALGFALVVALVIAAAYVGYQGSKSIHENAQELVRGHFVSSGRGAELEGQIETQSQELLDRLESVLGVCLVLAFGCKRSAAQPVNAVREICFLSDNAPIGFVLDFYWSCS